LPGHRQVRGMDRPCTSATEGVAQVPMFLAMLSPKGLLRWADREAMGPLPVACACRVKPAGVEGRGGRTEFSQQAGMLA
jgi:hypothetical protein